MNKFKFEPNEFIVGEEYKGKLVEIKEWPAIAEWPLYRVLLNEVQHFFMLPGDDSMWRYMSTPESLYSHGYTAEMQQQAMILSPQIYRQYIQGPTFGTGTLPVAFTEWPWAREDPNEAPDPICWRPDMKGLLTLSSVPSGKVARDLGFNVILPYTTKEAQLKDFCDLGGQIIFMKTKRDESKYNVSAYCVEDEPENRPQSRPLGEKSDFTPSTVWGVRNILDSKTQKPICCIFNDITLKSDTANYAKFYDFMMSLDFVVVDCYPYKVGIPDPVERMELSYSWIRGFRKPVGIIAQARYGGKYPKMLQPNIKEQNEFWRSRGYGIIWYVWSDGPHSIKEEFQGEIKEANEWEVI